MKCGGDETVRASCEQTDKGFSCHSSYTIPEMEPATDPELCGKCSILVPDDNGNMKWQHVDEFRKAPDEEGPDGPYGKIYARVGNTWHETSQYVYRNVDGLWAKPYDRRNDELIRYESCTGRILGPDLAAPTAQKGAWQSILAFLGIAH